MLEPGTVVHIRFGNQTAPSMARGIVMQAKYGIVLVQIKQAVPHASTAAGVPVQVHCWHESKFQQVDGVVQQLMTATPDGCAVRLRVQGEFTAAESRAMIRVPVAAQNLHAIINQEPDCAVTDISANGMGVIANSIFNIGAEVTVQMVDTDDPCAGTLVVRSAAPRPDRSIRYGLQAPHDAFALRRALQMLTQAVQRDKLRRRRDKR